MKRYLWHQKHKKAIKQYTKKRVLNVKNSPLELEKYFKQMKASRDDMDKFAEKELTISTIG